ncbi:hypothetical protein [Priestia sp. YIM B13448]|uniref:hypothetical protein n=1 Tax=Priestia sp. YIM B13448 TaxID=3366308 RepID=UPI00366E23F1
MSILEEYINIETVLDNTFIIAFDYPLSTKSKFCDDIWDFTDKKKERLKSVTDSKMKINWKAWQSKLPESIIGDIKVLAFFFLKCPTVVSQRNTIVSKGYKPNTISGYILDFLKFIHQIYTTRVIELPSGDNLNLLQSFSDILLEDIKDTAVKNKKSSQEIISIKKCLKSLGNPIVQKHLEGIIDWNARDIKNIYFAKKEDNKELSSYETQPLPDNYFQYISRSATVDVISFLKQMNMPIDSYIPKSYEKKLKQHLNKKSLRLLFDDYVHMRQKERNFAMVHQKRDSYTSEMKVKFYKKHGVKVSEFHNLLNHVHRASLFLLLQFTGVRYSEATTFKVGCLKKVTADVSVIRGAVIKHRDSKLPTDIDEWVACPIVRDSIKVLEEISRFTFNKYLLSSTYSVYLDIPEEPYSNSGINSLLSMYAADIDIEEKFSEMKKDKNGKTRRVVKREYFISVHRLRHTLALNLVRAKLGIPYISYHLKHVHTAIVAREKINNVTLGYGGISNELFKMPLVAEQAKEELINEIYHPNSPVEGGVNKDEFKKRRQEFFQGLMVDDEDFKEIMYDLKKSGAPFADVGLGYCGGKKEIPLKDGSKKPPPCVGQLQCNPVQCGNAVIPKSKIPMWIKIYKDNFAKLSDPYFQYAEKEIRQFVNESKEVLENFGVKVDDL